MANIATVIGRTNDATNYTATANQVYSAYNATFWNNSSQCYVDGVGTSHAAAHANFFPLVFGLVPPSNQTAVVNYLHSRIAANGGMPPSVYGAQYMLQAMFEAGDADTALGLITTNGPRSWMDMINIGSTLTDEAWSLPDKSNEDWNHAWGSAAGNLIANYVLGLRPMSPGFGQILIQPQLGQTLSYVQGVVPTIRGPVSISVSNAPGQFQLLANIPGNVTATVMLPAFGAANPVALVDGELVPATLSNNWLSVTGIGSGQHAIWLSTNSTVSNTTLYNNWASSWFSTNASNAAIAGPTANPDGNGFDNYNDFVTGVDPTNPNAHFAVNASTTSPNGLLMTVAGLTGRSYVLQRTLSLSPSSWSGILTNNNLAANQTLQFKDPQPPSSQVFYRILVTLP
jgi:Bacterial alpha-L-rhamnosidase 6 hairpin glycosidase domain/Bacterial alpha-L-rhamnosidase C-terminal domain